MASKKINMDGSDDIYYRYKMPGFDVSHGGAGNGRFTIFNNIEMIAKTINHPVSVITRYIASITGSSYIEARKQMTGTHTTIDLNRLIIEYNKHVVFCPKCNIPETIPSAFGSKKNSGIKLTCCACKTESELKPNNKYADKAIDLLIKYIANNKDSWVISKGTVVTSDIADNNPFDQVENIDEI